MDITLKVKGERVRFRMPFEPVAEGTVALDVAKRPKQLAFTFGPDADGKPSVRPALYAFNRDRNRLKLAVYIRRRDSSVPPAFKGKAGDGIGVMEFKREVGPAEVPAAQRKTDGGNFTAGDLEFELHQVKIAKLLRTPNPESHSDEFSNPYGGGGLELTWLIIDPKRRLRSLDREESEIEACTEDQGASLLKASGTDLDFAAFRERGYNGKLVIQFPQAIPSPGTKQIHLAGTLVVNLGEGEKIVTQKGVQVAENAVIPIGERSLTMRRSMDEKKTRLEFGGHEHLPLLHKIGVLGKGDQVTQSIEYGADSPRSASDNLWLSLPGTPATVDLQIVLYESLKKVQIPFAVDIVLGF